MGELRRRRGQPWMHVWVDVSRQARASRSRSLRWLVLIAAVAAMLAALTAVSLPLLVYPAL